MSHVKSTPSPFLAPDVVGAGRQTLKWQRWPSDVLPMWVAEMDVATCPPVRRELRSALDRGETGYGWGASYPTAMARFYHHRLGVEVDPEVCRVVPDVMQGCLQVLEVVTRPGDAVIVTPPVYGPFFSFVHAARRELVEAPLGRDGRLDPASLGRALDRATAGGRRAALLLCSPHNPTGVVHTAEELATVADLTAAAGVRVVVDEIHASLVRPDVVFTSWLDVPGGGDGVVVTSASKGFNLAGVKAGVAIPGTRAVDDVAAIPEVLSHGASLFGLRAHTVALDEGRSWQRRLVEAIDANHRLLADLVSEMLPDLHLYPAAATFLAWLDCRDLGWGADPAAVFRRHGRVGLNDGLFFGTGGGGHVRLNLATHPDLLREGVRRMVVAIDKVGTGAAAHRRLASEPRARTPSSAPAEDQP